MIRHSIIPVSTEKASTAASSAAAAPQSPAVDASNILRFLLTHFVHTIVLLITAVNAVGNALLRLLKSALVSLDWCRLYIAKQLEVHRRWDRFKDAVFYELMLLLFQPSVLMLVVLWPGWVLVIGLWLYSAIGGKAAAVVEA
jgi:hypothetical protein